MVDPSIANIPEEQKHTQEQHEMMKKELQKVIGGPVATGGTGKRGGFHWSM
jgi:bacteriocin-like protein